MREFVLPDDFGNHVQETAWRPDGMIQMFIDAPSSPLATSMRLQRAGGGPPPQQFNEYSGAPLKKPDQN